MKGYPRQSTCTSHKSCGLIKSHPSWKLNRLRKETRSLNWLWKVFRRLSLHLETSRSLMKKLGLSKMRRLIWITAMMELVRLVAKLWKERREAIRIFRPEDFHQCNHRETQKTMIKKQLMATIIFLEEMEGLHFQKQEQDWVVPLSWRIKIMVRKLKLSKVGMWRNIRKASKQRR